MADMWMQGKCNMDDENGQKLCVAKNAHKYVILL